MTLPFKNIKLQVDFPADLLSSLQSCHSIFSRHMDLIRHQREVCSEEGQTPTHTPKGRSFKCQEPGCSHLAFYQVLRRGLWLG